MPAQTTTLTLSGARSLSRPGLGGIGAWTFSAATIVFLALNNGGYDAIPREQVGIAVWWIVLVGAACGLLHPLRAGRPALVVLGLLTLFAVWTGFSFVWTDSDERTAEEFARAATYVGIFVLGLAGAAAGHSRQLATGAFGGVVAIVVIAVLSRMHPEWFPENIAGVFLPGIELEARLAYPLNYSSGLGAFAALGIPLALWVAADAKTIAGRAAAAGALPLLGICVYLTTSGGALLVVIAAVTTYLLLSGDRLPDLLTLSIGGLGAALLASAVDQRAALDRGLPTPAAIAEGHEVLALILIVCAGAALLQAALGLAVRDGTRPRILRVDQRFARRAGVVAFLAGVVIAVAGGAAGSIEHRWEVFTDRAPAGGDAPASDTRRSQLLNFSGSGRYEFWLAAQDAAKAHPWTGTGAGTFEFWWGQNPRYAAFVRDSHSLYFDTLAELGWIGVLMVGALLLAIIGVGVLLVLRGPPARRSLVAGGAAVAGGFAVAAAVDWQWELAAVPAVFLAVSAAFLGRPEGPPRRGAIERGLVCGLAVAGLIAVAIPLASHASLRASQAAVAAGQLQTGLDAAVRAEKVAPFAGTPVLQRALILERAGDLPGAAAAALRATRKDPVNFRPWLILARIEVARGNAETAVAAYRRSLVLDPQSGVKR